MRKYTIITLILILLLAPFVTRALPPIWVDDGGLGTGDGSGSGTGSNAGGPSGYTFCALENERCNFSGTKDVAYGLNKFFNYKYKVVDGIDCNNSVFGDPNYGVVKACYIKDSISSSASSSSSDLSVQTDPETNITYTTARLHGTGGYNSFDPATASTLPLITAYFRYAKAKNNPPIFCNDIYGTNMISTKDIKIKGTDLNTTGKATFYQNISGLTPDTTYYYCAIVSNKNVIAYGGSKIVKQLHTSPYGTTVKTVGATKIKSNSATLNGSYSSIDAVTTYFEYKEAMIDGTSTAWKQIGEKNYSIAGAANIYGDISIDLTKLTPSTRYQFRAVAVTNKLNIESKTFYGSTLNFTTSVSNSEGDNGNGGGVSTGSKRCTNGATNYPNCNNTGNPNCPPGSSCSTNSCRNGATNYPNCDNSVSKNSCTNGATNYPTCSLVCLPGAACTCINGNINPPACTISPDTSYKPQCSDNLDNDKDGKIDVFDSDCYQDGDLTKNYFPTHYSESSSPYNPNDFNNPYNPNSPYNPNNPNYNPNNPNPYNPNDPNNPYNQGTWGTLPGTGPGTSGTWGTGTDSGTWRATTGTGGTGIVYWAGNGDGTGTWYSTNGSGTWTNGRNTGSAGTGTWANLVLGQKATPPWDAIVRYHEGIETVFIRQIINKPIFTQKYGYQEGMNLQIFAGDLADQFARAFGYVNASGREIRVSLPDIAAYQLVLVGNKLTVYEYYDNKIVDIRNVTTVFKNASGYEYYFKKN